MTTLVKIKSQEQIDARKEKTLHLFEPKELLETETEAYSRDKSGSKSSGNLLYDVILTSILQLLQFLYLVNLSFKSLKYCLQSFYHWIWQTENTDIHSRIRHDKAQLTRIPTHLTINVSRELYSSKTCADWERTIFDLSLATCWAWEFGIKEVSVYDSAGVMKSMEVDLHKQQSKMLHSWIKMSGCFTEKMNRLPPIKFAVLSSENGKPNMAKITQELARNHSSVEQINIELVDKSMHETISDPDLMIVYDGLPHNYISLDGYPPWHIRLTEIANCTSSHILNYDLFSKCLYRFSKVEQRFGR